MRKYLFHVFCPPVAIGLLSANLMSSCRTTATNLTTKSKGKAAEGPVNADDNVLGRWSPLYDWNIIPVHAIALPDGRVLGYGTTPKNNGNLQSAEQNFAIWSPGGQVQLSNNKSDGSDIFCSGVQLLPDGNVMIVGGDTRNPPNDGINAVNFFSPETNRIERSEAGMISARWYPTATTVPDGRILIHGGRAQNGQPQQVPEIFDGQFRALPGAMNDQITGDAEGKWFYPRDWVDPRGNIFGLSGNTMYTLTLDGNGGQQVNGYLPNKTRSHISSAVMYRPGQILQVGGSTNGDTQAAGSNQAITVDIRGPNPIVQDAPNMAWARVWAHTTVLPNGEVFVSNGSARENLDIGSARMTEMWNPDTRQFRNLRAQQEFRLYHGISILLADGSVMVGGGGAPGPRNGSDYQIYYPPYLFTPGGNEAPRPTYTDFQRVQNWGNNVTVNTSGNIASASLIRLGSVTHSFDNGQRFIPLNVTNNGNNVTFQMPGNANIAPPGYYWLFLNNNAGVPSIAKVVSLGGGKVPGNPVGFAEGPPPGANPNPNPNPNPGGAFDPNPNATYQIISAMHGKCMDIDGGNPANGAKIIAWDCDKNNPNQRFRFLKAGNRYKIQSVITNKCLDIESPNPDDGLKPMAASHQWDCLDFAKNQNVEFQPRADGAYSLQLEASGQCIEVPYEDQANGRQLGQYNCKDAKSNEWKIVP